MPSRFLTKAEKERLALKAREEAVNETYQLLLPILDDEIKANLDKLGRLKREKTEQFSVAEAVCGQFFG